MNYVIKQWTQCGVDLHGPVLSVGEVTGTLIDLQGALTWALAFILLHSEEDKNKSELKSKLKSVPSDSFRQNQQRILEKRERKTL